MLLTRTLSPEDFGLWNIINSMIGYVIIMEPMISYWSTREIARGTDSGKTSIISSGIFSLGAIIVYSIITFLFHGSSSISFEVLFFGAILIPVMFLNKTLTAINLAWKPHAISYGVILFGISQIIMAYILLVVFEMGISGIIISVTFGYLMGNIVLLIFAKEKLKDNFQIKFIKKWLRLSWISFYPEAYTLFTNSYVIIFVLITNSVESIGFWSAALILSSVVGNAALISRGVYPKLLGTKNRDYVQNNITHLFYFAIPLVSLVIVFSKPGLYALNPIYESVYPVVIITAIMSFFYNLTMIFQSFSLGTENVDLSENSSTKEFLKSKLFLNPSVLLIQSIVYAISLSIGLLILLPISTMNDLLIFWAILAVVTQIPVCIYFYRKAQKKINFNLEFFTILKYILASVVVFGITYLISESYLIYDDNLLQFLPHLMIFGIIGVFGYLGFTYLIDKKTRLLFNAIFSEFKKIISF
jgi:O-antigen/teichoic acid export membrane protein